MKKSQLPIRAILTFGCLLLGVAVFFQTLYILNGTGLRHIILTDPIHSSKYLTPNAFEISNPNLYFNLVAAGGSRTLSLQYLNLLFPNPFFAPSPYQINARYKMPYRNFKRPITLYFPLQHHFPPHVEHLQCSRPTRVYNPKRLRSRVWKNPHGLRIRFRSGRAVLDRNSHRRGAGTGLRRSRAPI